MSVATTTALAIGGIAAAGVSGGLSYAGQKGVSSSENSAAQLQAQEAANSLAFQKQEFNTEQTNQAPFLQAGQNAIGNLTSLMAPGGSLSQQWTGQFAAPTAAQAAATPGYQFALDQGRSAIQNSAAAQGNLISGGSEAALDQYSQGLASNTYQQSFNNALTQYQQGYNQFQQGQANTYNRLANIAGLGQTSAAQLGSEGQAAANEVTATNLSSGAQIGQDYVNAAGARASGYNAIGNSLTSGTNNLVSGLTLQQLLSAQNNQQATPVNYETGDADFDYPGMVSPSNG